MKEMRMRLFPLTIAVALSASLALSACASRKPTPTRLDPLAGSGATDPAGATTPGGTAGAGLPGGPGAGGFPGGGTAGAAAPGSLQDFVISAGDRVYFATDSHELTSEAAAVLDAQVRWLNRYPAIRVIVEGNADERGTREYNLALGARRATSVREFLVSRGIAPSRIETVSYGKERPVAAGTDEAALQQNRNARTNFQGQGG
jgi:peptidoglycan-associated lipoprotein